MHQAWRQDRVTGGGGGGGAELNFGGHEKFIYVNLRGARGTKKLSQSGSNEEGEDQRIKGIFRLKSRIQAVSPAENR